MTTPGQLAMDSTTHVYIPDLQVKPGAPTAHLRWIGQYLVERFAGNPDVKFIQAGDWGDMPSLSSYDRGKKAMEGRRYIRDVAAVNESLEILTGPIDEYNKGRRVKWRPERFVTLGNHEDRVSRAAEDDAQLDGLVTLDDLRFEDFGWKTVPYKQPIELDGVNYCHFFYNPMTSRPYSGQSMDARIKTVGFSFTQGHQQGLQYGMRHLNNGGALHGLVAGSCYLHDEDYAGPQGNNNWRGIVVKHQVEKGRYDPMFVSLDYLCRRFEGCKLRHFLQRGRRR